MNLIQITDKNGQKIEEKPLDLEKVKARLQGENGPKYWQTLEEVAAEPGFNEMLKREFGHIAPKDWAPLPRREFVKLMGAALALAGLSGCAFQPQEKIVPFVKAPEEQLPGIPLFYATTMPMMGYGIGLLAESSEGRPTKLEGNPEHPASNGRTDVFAQAEVLCLWDPERSQFVRQSSASSNWDAFAGALADQVQQARRTRGAGFALVTETITSPSQLAQIEGLRRALPQMTWVSYEALSRDNVRDGIRLAFGRDLHPVYHFDRADRIVSLDCDFLHEEPGHVEYGRDFISGRKLISSDGRPVAPGAATMNRLYTIESTMTTTGAQADHRFPVKASQVESIARAMAAALGVAGAGEAGKIPQNVKDALPAILADLQASRGRVIVVAGSHQPPAVHALAHAITAKLGGAGATGTISYHAPFDGNPARSGAGMNALIQKMNAGQIQTAIFLNTNPAYTLPADAKFAEALKKVAFTAHVGPYEDETSALCEWHAPSAHFLEYWGDVRALDGTVSLIQPLIQPLYEAAKSPLEILSTLAIASAQTRDVSQTLAGTAGASGGMAPMDGVQVASGYDTLRSFYINQRGGRDDLRFQKFWQDAVHAGYLAGTAAPAVGVAPVALNLPAPTGAIEGLEINFRPDPTILDGRYANNGWLQECPKPTLHTVWDNAILVAPDTANEFGWKNNTEVSITANGQTVTGGVYLLPGQPEGVITAHLGYGRTQVGKIGQGTGFNANLIRSSISPWFIEANAANVKATGGVYKIANTNTYNIIAPKGKETTFLESVLHSDEAKTKVIDGILTPESRELDIDGLHGRDLVRVGTLADYRANHLPTSPMDKKGVPLAYPQNPDEFRKYYVEHHPDSPENHGGGHGEEHFAWRKQPMQDDRELEGFPSFYPRNTDTQALTPFKDASVNAEEEAKSKAEGRDNQTHQWGMSVDLQSCIGCNACVVACQSENNTAVVGKDQVLMGRTMHWMRIDTYYRGSYENPEVYFEPMMCQHCEKAPCAPVCPFNAVMESPEGINEQIYNRCVGTKYCENNCPYKVRRFNFLQYSDQQTPQITLMANPNVTVRSRGVMEKCTYCIQRVDAAKWQADKEDRRVRDGDIIPACAQSCPTDAIVFGDINDPNSVVSRHKRGPLTFGLLTEFNTMPRTTYTARFKNPNPALAKLEDQNPAKLERKGEEAGGHGAEGDGDHGGKGGGHGAEAEHKATGGSASNAHSENGGHSEH